MNKLLLLSFSLISLSLIAGSCGATSKSQDTTDSINPENALLDSIRQDSIARRNFTSPDLTFHDLHGDVKEMYESASNQTFKFDENGKWTNTPKWDDWCKKVSPEKTKKPRVVRNKEGYITRIYNDCDADEEYIDITWKNGQLPKGSKDHYNDLGFLIYDECKEGDGKDPAYVTVYCNYKVDEMGNWVSRDVYTKSYDPSYPDETTDFDKRTEKRKITYYKSNGGTVTTIPNNKKQTAILNSLKKQEKEYTPQYASGNESNSYPNAYENNSNNNASNSNKYSNYANEAQILGKLKDLGEKGRRMMPQIEALYSRYQQAQRNGILSNPQAQFDLNDAIGKLIDIKNEQIRLAQELGDDQLVREYRQQRDQVYRAKDKMMYGR